MDYNEINNYNSIVSQSDIVIDNIINIIISVILLVLSIVFLIKSIRLIGLINNKKSVYDKYVERLLTEYDRLIVETNTYPVREDTIIIKISKFAELLDVRDSLKMPIMYYSITKHHKCYFYIAHENKIYLNVVKSIDLAGNDK